MLELTQFGIDTWLILKIAAIVGLLLYNVFAFVIVRQVTHMTKTLKVGFETPIILFATIHMLFSLGLLLFAIFFL